MLDDIFSGEKAIQLWLVLFLASILVGGIVTGFFKARKIQPKGFKWKVFRNEGIFGMVNLAASAFLIGAPTAWLTSNGYIATTKGAADWWTIAFEYALYFFLFDTWFYWLHRAMHQGRFYTYVHKLHHLSTSPNLLTTLSVNPLESLINGGFVPLFLVAMTFIAPISEQSMALVEQKLGHKMVHHDHIP